MKRILFLLAVIALLFSLAACGGAPAPGDTGELNTLGDALSAESSYYYSSWSPEKYVYVFDNNGEPYRVVANMTQELYDAVSKIDFSDPDHNSKLMEVLGKLPLESVENLSEGIPDQKELDRLVGKTGQELLDDGFSVSGYSTDGDAEEFTLAQGPYQYLVTFNEPAPADAENAEDDGIRELTLKSITYNGLSNNCVDIDSL